MKLNKKRNLCASCNRGRLTTTVVTWAGPQEFCDNCVEVRQWYCCLYCGGLVALELGRFCDATCAHSYDEPIADDSFVAGDLSAATEAELDQVRRYADQFHND